MKKCILILTLCLSYVIVAQELTAPPPPKIEISADKKSLVDELIKVTNFENYESN